MAVRRPNRPATTQLIEAVAETFALAPEGVSNRKLHNEAFQLLVYLLRRVRNLPLKEVPVMTILARGSRKSNNIYQIGLDTQPDPRVADDPDPVPSASKYLVRK